MYSMLSSFFDFGWEVLVDKYLLKIVNRFPQCRKLAWVFLLFTSYKHSIYSSTPSSPCFWEFIFVQIIREYTVICFVFLSQSMASTICSHSKFCGGVAHCHAIHTVTPVSSGCLQCRYHCIVLQIILYILMSFPQCRMQNFLQAYISLFNRCPNQYWQLLNS